MCLLCEGIRERDEWLPLVAIPSSLRGKANKNNWIPIGAKG